MTRLKLPDEIRDRLGERGLNSITRDAGGRTVEVRAWTRVELRESTRSDGVRVVGYASTFNRPYPIYGGAEQGGFDETVAPGAFDKSLKEQDDVRLVVNHDGVPLARTRSGTLTLEADDIGLLVDAELDPTSPLVQGLRSAMERGDMDQMSMAFVVTAQQWSGDYSQRRITEVRLHDVSIVTFPANPATMAIIGTDTERPRPAEPAPAGLGIHLVRADWYGLDSGSVR